MNNTFNRTKVNKLTGNVGLSYKIFDKITASAKYQFNYADVATKGFSPLVWYGNGILYIHDATRTDGNSSLTLRKVITETILLMLTLSTMILLEKIII